MSWDARTRRRQNSTASSRSLPIHSRQKSRHIATPKSEHVSDPFLQDFLASSFDPAEYLNATLPPLQSSTGTSSVSRAGSQTAPTSAAVPVPLADLSAQAQTTLTQLNAHTTRLTNTLTQITDDILRSGSRLAYEVELLRGETLGLAEALTDGLHDDIARFVPAGIADAPEVGAAQRRASIVSRAQSDRADPAAVADGSEATIPATAAEEESSDPEYISQLRTLTMVRSQLESVIKIFGDAMEFVFPPSELSVSSSFLSVSGPDAGSSEVHSTEEKGQQVLRNLRDEIAGLLAPRPGADADDPIRGIEEAARRIEELKELTRVWKGTAEEKGRTRFIESLAKMVEDRHKELLRDMEQQQAKSTRSSGDGSGAVKKGVAAGTEAAGGVVDNKGYAGGYGLIQQLQKIRGGL